MQLAGIPVAMVVVGVVIAVAAAVAILPVDRVNDILSGRQARA